ncbi:MAG TPA: BON domain-containing protein [Blastocatellia bacterium]|jgi:osmotically-inducible protein OsmY|nr:BON domain-containing protein [Blastocatellia bacterium]
MKRLLLAVFLCLYFTCGYAVAQDGSSKSSGKSGSGQGEQVDCSAVNDSGITSSVKERFAKSPALKDAGIGVDTRNGVVTLTGRVKNGGLKGVATRVTKRINCVRKVDNQLSVEQSKEDGKGSKSSN